MKNKPNEERISRKAAALQWTGNNTQAVMERLAQHGMIGELFRDIYIQVYKEGSYSDTLNIRDWLVEGEDGRLRIYDDETHALMYRPIVKDVDMEFTDNEVECLMIGIAAQNDELERMRAFARKMIDYGANNQAILIAAIEHGLLIPGVCGGCELADSLKAHE